MSRIHLLYGFMSCLLLLSACNTTKYIPEGKYLLEKVDLEMDDKGADPAALLPYIQQKANASKWGIYVYNLVDNDSNFIKKFIRKTGEPPVIFNPEKVNLSVHELGNEMKNLGYLNTQVSVQVDTTEKKAQVVYRIHNGEPYRIRNYTIDIQQVAQRNNRLGNRRTPNIRNRPNVSRPDSNFFRNRGLIRTGTIFDMNTLEKERQRMSTQLRNQGYYLLTENNLHYFADTTLRSNQVDLSLALLDTAQMIPYTIRRVNVYSGYDLVEAENYQVVDSAEQNGIHIYYDKLRFLRPRVIAEKIRVRPGGVFRERAGESTFSAFQALNCMGRVDVQYVDSNYSDSTLLDCNIYLTPGTNHSLQAGLEGTNKAGDIGLALDVTYGNLNIFNGSEIFNVHLRGAYEFVGGLFGDNSGYNYTNHNYYELEIEPSLTFPKLHLPFFGSQISERYNTQTRYSLGFDIQRRPEYVRNFFNFSWKLKWSSQRSMVSHTLSLLDINYVYMPWMSSEFIDYLLDDVNELTRMSYNDNFTAGMNYNLIYSNANAGRIRQNLYTVRFNAETSGNALYLISKATHVKKNEVGQYQFFNNPFGQYVKGDIDFAQMFRLDANSGLAFRVGIGVGYPYLNGVILPFEKRYYGGGPNNVRGWSTRYLGPGNYNQDDDNPAIHNGDISLILSAEYRLKVLPWLEPALFVDAGNIWTIKDYSYQPGGLFQWNKFYKEIAVGTGFGFRFDLSFLILRLDAGIRIFDPALEEGHRFAFLKGRFLKNSAVYIAIGYPF
ncbi:membrane protein [Bacteroidia bacterium]|nr:membrane protein [Bacteroidia bacterium]